MSEVEVVVQDVLVDVRQHQLLLRAAQDGHADQPDVGVLRLGLLREGHPEQAGVQLGHGEEGQVGGGAEPGREGEGQGESEWKGREWGCRRGWMGWRRKAREGGVGRKVT